MRKEDRISQLAASKDVHKSAAIATFQTNNEISLLFPNLFGLKIKYLYIKYIYIVYLSCDFVTRIVKKIYLKIGKSSLVPGNSTDSQ